jgi:hypothetical protein
LRLALWELRTPEPLSEDTDEQLLTQSLAMCSKANKAYFHE